jgi:hypothetical protein
LDSFKLVNEFNRIFGCISDITELIFAGFTVDNEYVTNVKAIIPIILLPMIELKKFDELDISINFTSRVVNNMINGINSNIN